MNLYKNINLSFSEYIKKILLTFKKVNSIFCFKIILYRCFFDFRRLKNIDVIKALYILKNKIYKASLFVLSSNYEGMPNALMEAMALGIPCISTDCPCGGPRFLIKNGYNGYLVHINDIQGLHKTIQNVLHKEQTEISKRANKIIIKLNPNKINQDWHEYINKIIKGETNEFKNK